MLFNSLTYLFFLTVITALYWVLPKRMNLYVIFFASIFFYGFWRPEFLIILAVSALIDYFSALRISVTEDLSIKRKWLTISILSNLTILIYFKYGFFILDNGQYIGHMLGMDISVPALDILLPLGISFYTFEAISYIVDVYRGFYHAEKNLIRYFAFICFFPKMIAGPILRSKELIPQFLKRPEFNLSEFLSGLERIIYGLFLKVVVADNIAPLVEAGFITSNANLSAVDVLTLAFLFGFQIYFDFSGYSSIAIGSARLFGIHIPENFNFPYSSGSPREFWQRWHISLSSWIRDYIYLPLQKIKVKVRSAGGISSELSFNKKNFWSSITSLALTWSIMGIWHGANWTFVIWGLYHAIIILIYRIMRPFTSGLKENRFLKLVGGLLTLIIIMIGWIPFRSESPEQAITLLSKLLYINNYLWLGLRENTYLIAALLFMATLIAFKLHNLNLLISKNNFLISTFKTLSLSIAIVMVFIFLRPISQFIYFQF